MLAPWEKSYDQPRQDIKKQRHYFVDKGSSIQSYGFSSSHVLICELDHKECWATKNWCFWTVVLEKTLESPLDCKEIKTVYPKGNQSWIFIGRTDAEVEAPVLWPPDAKAWLIGKDPYAGEDWRQEEKGTTEDEMVGWHLWLDGHEFEQALGVCDGQGSLVCAVHGFTKARTWQQLNWTDKRCLNNSTAQKEARIKKKLFTSLFPLPKGTIIKSFLPVHIVTHTPLKILQIGLWYIVTIYTLLNLLLNTI